MYWERASVLAFLLRDGYFAKYPMRLARLISLLPLLTFVAGSIKSLSAQDTRYVPEPTFPKTCAVYRAPLFERHSGPVVGKSKTEQDAESSAESERINWLIAKRCSPGEALELALGANSERSAFLINPIALPEGISLIVDGGVTVYGSRNPENYQAPSPTNAVCGTIGKYGVDQGCAALVTISSGGGVYGYGVIDGQGDKLMLGGINANKSTWWDLTIYKKDGTDGTCPQPDPTNDVSSISNDVEVGENGCEQASPVVISSPNTGTNLFETDLTLYKITIRNPPFHTVRLIADRMTVWGAKVQAPWNLPNTDGFDVRGSDITFYDVTVANGDQQIVLVSNGGPTKNVTIDHFHGYSKGGVTILGNGDTTSQVLVKESELTGAVPSLVRANVDGKPEMIVNGVPESVLQKEYGLQSYGQALPNATDQIQGLQITNKSSTTSGSGTQVSDVTYRSICMSDVVRPINLVLDTDQTMPSVQRIHFEDIHILKPTAQLPLYGKGKIADPAQLGGYEVSLDAAPDSKGFPSNPNSVSFENVIFDRAENGGNSISSLSAIGNEISTALNIFPRLFNRLEAGDTLVTKTVGNTALTLQANKYRSRTPVSVDFLARGCRPMPFTVGELYLSLGRETGRSNNLREAVIRQGETIMLNAVVQPVMSQTTLFTKGSYGSDPGLVALASPKLTQPIKFYDGGHFIGVAKLSANGTLASFTMRHLSPGFHWFRAVYPSDRYYDSMSFGSVTVQVVRQR
jgi:polygalacturonase